jgi:hypothetical protein
MPPQTLTERQPLTAWQTELLRLTTFFSQALQSTEQHWWADLIREEPENRIVRPREGVRQEDGQFEGGKLVLAVQPIRADWLFGPTDDQTSLGPFPESLDHFQPLIMRWLDVCPSVQRLAFGATVNLPMPDLQTAYRRISAYLPSVEVDADHSTDLFYQINRARDSNCEVPGLRINRLSKWAVITRISGTLALQSRQAPLEVFTGPQEAFCHLELDINSAANFPGELPRHKLRDIFQELVHLGQEIIAEGDVP